MYICDLSAAGVKCKAFDYRSRHYTCAEVSVYICVYMYVCACELTCIHMCELLTHCHLIHWRIMN